MESLEKCYFFYKSTPEYKKIQNRLEWSIVAIIYTSIIRMAIGNSYEFFMNIIIAIATGYLISYFYFKLITYKSIYDEELISLKVTTEIGIYLSKIYNEVNSGDDSNIKLKLLVFIDLLYPYKDIYKKFFYARVKMEYIMEIINFSSQKNIDKILFNDLMMTVIPRYVSIIHCFEDKELIVEEFMTLKNKGYYPDEIEYLLELYFLAEKAPDTSLDT